MVRSLSEKVKRLARIADIKKISKTSNGRLLEIQFFEELHEPDLMMKMMDPPQTSGWSVVNIIKHLRKKLRNGEELEVGHLALVKLNPIDKYPASYVKPMDKVMKRYLLEPGSVRPPRDLSAPSEAKLATPCDPGHLSGNSVLFVCVDVQGQKENLEVNLPLPWQQTLWSLKFYLKQVIERHVNAETTSGDPFKLDIRKTLIYHDEAQAWGELKDLSQLHHYGQLYLFQYGVQDAQMDLPAPKPVRGFDFNTPPSTCDERCDELTLLVCADIRNRKENLEILTPPRFTLQSLEIHLKEVVESDANAEPHSAPLKLDIKDVFIYDDATLSWVFLKDLSQLHDYDQLYLFQHGVQDVQTDLPTPRPVRGAYFAVENEATLTA
eukprot:TRINITY_DN630_c0_g1_i4.p1 TRINITY_DN630_c0_g1~~TRINITY_DN630_c0_g1_i4.p1  ORF type:complete len:380 (+),score=58.94 TRINITY_DN630_c0_g1_i4:155-1294(+)